MKFQKIDQKQVPQVAALSVLCLAVLGYGGYSFFSGRPAGTPAAAASPARDTEKRALDATRTAPKAAPSPVVAGLYNSDPFRPAIKMPQPPPQKGSSTPAPREFQPAPAGPLDWPGGEGPRAFPGPPKIEKPAVPAAPERPAVVVTGVIDSQDGVDMALVQLGTDRRIIQVGDMLANNYRVKRIGMDGVLLVNGADRFFVGLGAKPNG